MLQWVFEYLLADNSYKTLVRDYPRGWKDADVLAHMAATLPVECVGSILLDYHKPVVAPVKGKQK